MAGWKRELERRKEAERQADSNERRRAWDAASRRAWGEEATSRDVGAEFNCGETGQRCVQPRACLDRGGCNLHCG